MTPPRICTFVFRWLLPAVFTLSVFAPNALAQRAATPVYGAYCVASQTGQRMEYFSDAFATADPDAASISNAYKAYLAQKYSQPYWGGGCQTFGSVAAANAAKQGRIAELAQGRWAIEETGWKSASLPSARSSNKAPVAATTPNGEKTACQLIAKSTLESIVGVHFFAAKSGPADEKVVSLIAPRIIASSSCQYFADRGGVTLTIWYTEPFSPKIAKYDLLNYEEHNLTGGDDVTSRDFPYPAAFTSIGSGTYVFKNGPKGLTVLEVESNVSATEGETAQVARDKKIALKILGLPGPQQRLSAHAATGGIIYLPAAYWYAYRTDIIRQVVEGDFQSDWDSSSQFQDAFATYVEGFSTHCRAYLPANHVTLRVTQTEVRTNGYGNVISQRQLLGGTVEVDPRFVPKYQEYSESDSAEGLADALAVASGRLTMDDIFAAANDMIKFFSIETCQSPVMHQLGENLLRAAEGESPVRGMIRAVPSQPAADLQPIAPSKPTEVFDGTMPNYTITSAIASSEISQYCRGLYDPTFSLLTPQQDKFRNAHLSEANAEAGECASKFDPHEVATHRRIAMHYCLGKYDYLLVPEGQSSNAIYAYRECMAQNDTLTALCTMELRYRAELRHFTNLADQNCTAPQANDLEGDWIRQKNDIRALGAIPPNGPGLPPVLLAPMKPGILQRAGMAPAIPKLPLASAAQAAPTQTSAAEPVVSPAVQGATAPRQPATPVVKPPNSAAVPRSTVAPTQETRQERAAEQRKLGQEFVACEQQALKDNPQRGPAFTKAMSACAQQLRAAHPR
jgi:hypothetical protein